MEYQQQVSNLPTMWTMRLFVGVSLLFVPVLQAHSIAGVDEKLREAVDFLETVGISGLCHPTSNDFAPLFPHCDVAGSLHQRGLATEESANELWSKDDWFYIQNSLLAALCVCTAALAAGLTLGLLSLDPLNLLVKMRTASSEEEKRQAASLLPIVRQHHLLLVTLLLLNSMANEALPLFLDAVVPSYIAIILSVTLVLFFGEIIPSAICTGPDRIKVASRLAPLVRFFMFLLYPISFPIAKLLDVVLHDEDEDSAFSRLELSALVRIQYEERLVVKKRRKQEKLIARQAYSGLDESLQSKRLTGVSTSVTSITPTRPTVDRSQSLHFDEVTMLEGALNMKTKMAMDVYTPLRNVFAVPYDVILTEARIVEIYSSGYSRVPVFKNRPDKEKEKSGIVGVLLTKQLIVVNTDDERPVCQLPLLVPFCVSLTMNLVDLINVFQAPSIRGKGGHCHMAIVCSKPLLAEQALDRGEPIPEEAGVMGLVTLEDCLEELLQEEIYDETDHSEIQRMKGAKWAWRKWRLFVQKRKIKKEEESVIALHSPALLNIVGAATALHDAEHGESTPLIVPITRQKPDKKPYFGLF